MQSRRLCASSMCGGINMEFKLENYEKITIPFYDKNTNSYIDVTLYPPKDETEIFSFEIAEAQPNNTLD